MSMLVAFRFIDSDGEPTGYYGIAAAKNKLELFHKIDEHGSAFDVEIKTLSNASICLHVNENYFKDDEDKDPKFDGEYFKQIELSDIFIDAIQDFGKGKFKKPIWNLDKTTEFIYREILQ